MGRVGRVDVLVVLLVYSQWSMISVNSLKECGMMPSLFSGWLPCFDVLLWRLLLLVPTQQRATVQRHSTRVSVYIRSHVNNNLVPRLHPACVLFPIIMHCHNINNSQHWGWFGSRMRQWRLHHNLVCHKIPYTRVNKCNPLWSAYCLSSAHFFPGFQ